MSQPQIKIDLNATKPILCKCGNNTFRQVFILRSVPRVMTGSLQDQQMNIPVYVCAKCGHLNDRHDPFNKKKDAPGIQK